MEPGWTDPLHPVASVQSNLASINRPDLITALPPLLGIAPMGWFHLSKWLSDVLYLGLQGYRLSPVGTLLLF